MEASALNHTATLPALGGRSPLLRLKSDEQLIVLVRRGQHAAFEALVQRYQSRLLAFCRHMLGSTEDAEDVLQEVFAASFNAMIADERPINARPWLYRIARNRCLNHLRRPQHAGQDSMDVFERDGGLTTADAVHKREEFRQIVSDVQDLPETQKTALLLREIDALSYDQIAEAMETTVPSVKSLLVRARVSLAEAAEARLLTCEEVRLELGQVAEGLAKTTPPARRHLKSCERCRLFKGELRRANRALAAVYPLGPLVIVKKFFIGKLGALAGSTGASTSGAAAGIGSGAGGAVAGSVGATAGAGAGGALSASFGAIATKAAAGLAAAALVTAAGVEVKQVAHPQGSESAHVAVQIASAQPAPPVAAPAPVRRAPAAVPAVVAAKQEPATANADAKTAKQPAPSTPAPATPPPDTTAAAPADTTTSSTSTQPAPQPTPVDPVQEDGSVVVLDPSGSNSTGDGSGNQWDQPGDGQGDPGAGGGANSGPSGSGSTPPGESTGTPSSPQPAPVAGEHAPAHRTIAAVRRVLRHR